MASMALVSVMGGLVGSGRRSVPSMPVTPMIPFRPCASCVSRLTDHEYMEHGRLLYKMASAPRDIRLCLDDQWLPTQSQR